MRIRINFSESGTCSLHQVKGWFEDTVLGKGNGLHDMKSQYSLTGMIGNSAYFTTGDEGLMSGVMMSLLSAGGSRAGGKTYVNFGQEKDFHVHSDFDLVRTITPVLLRSHGKTITIEDPEFIGTLTESCRRKLTDAGFDRKKVESIALEPFHPERFSVVDVKYGGIHNFASRVMLVVRGDRKARETLYNLGLGKSTGCGFGSVTVNE